MLLRRASGFFLLLVLGTALLYATHTVAAASTSPAFSSSSGLILRISNPAAERIEWTGLKPSNFSDLGTVQSVNLELHSKASGTLYVQCSPLRSSSGRILPSSRLGLVEGTASYRPFSFGNRWEPIGSYQAGNHSITLNFTAHILADDAAGIYETTIRFMFQSNQESVSCELGASIEVSEWTSISCLQPSIDLSGQNGPEEDLYGYVEIAINSNSSWKLSVACQDELLSSNLMVIEASALLYRCEGTSAWHPLQKYPQWSVVASGTGSTTLRVHFRITGHSVRSYASGFYSGAIKFKIDYY